MRHNLSNKNYEERTATCVICGEVKIKKKGNSWQCRVAIKEYKKRIGYKSYETSAHKKLRLQLQESQNGLCFICQIPGAKYVDHDHLTNKVRGVLCRDCNLGLGLFKDNVESLKMAIKYLLRHAPTHSQQ